MNESMVSRWAVVVVFCATACHASGGDHPDGGMPAIDAPTDAPPAVIVTQIGPTGGFVPQVAFQPGARGVVWASGDDASGLYRSTDGGATWAIAATGAPNQSTYALRFDPHDPTKIYAPNHFGRGMLRSTDGGTTWIAAQAGLPITGQPSQVVNDLAISPANSALIFAATDAGLYRSTDSGATFALLTTALPGTAQIRALAFRADGVLFVGTGAAALDYLASPGDPTPTWTQALPPSASPTPPSLNVLVFSATALYLGYNTGSILRVPAALGPSTTINDPSVAGSIQSANRLSIAVISGASPTTDTVYVGTMTNGTIAAAQFGLFKSTTGGGAWTQTMTGMAGNSIMSIGVDPANASNVVVGSGSGLGICHSADAAATWTCVTAGIYATASLALAQDPTNPAHLLASNTAAGGFSRNFESTDHGATWAGFADPAPIVADGIFAFDIDPAHAQNVLAGTYSLGIVRSTGGTAGPWSSVIATPGDRVDRFVRDRATPAIVYAVMASRDATPSPFIYLSTDGGATFATRSQTAFNLAPHPTHAGEAIAVTPTDAVATTDSFATSHALGLGAQFPSEPGFTAAAFDPAAPTTVLVAGASGALYLTTNYTPGGGGMTWTKLASPVVAADIRDVIIVDRGGRAVLYAATAAGDTGVTTGATQGVFRSLDSGATWTALSDAMFPGSIVWRLIPDATAPTTDLLAGMWAPGLFAIHDTE